MKKFKVHMMYDPKTGKGYKALTMADHNRMNQDIHIQNLKRKKQWEVKCRDAVALMECKWDLIVYYKLIKYVISLRIK